MAQRLQWDTGCILPSPSIGCQKQELFLPRDGDVENVGFKLSGRPTREARSRRQARPALLAPCGLGLDSSCSSPRAGVGVRRRRRTKPLCKSLTALARRHLQRLDRFLRPHANVWRRSWGPRPRHRLRFPVKPWGRVPASAGHGALRFSGAPRRESAAPPPRVTFFLD